MKLIHSLLTLPLLLLTLAASFTACDRDYDMPPLNEPTYSLPDGAQTITIKELRTKYAAATSSNAITITDSLFLHAYVCGDDRSGNIFKTIYIQDETGGISFLVDQSDVYNDYAAGQEVYIDLKGLCISVYGNEQQIGHPDGYLYRTPYEDFKEHVHCNKWADESQLTVKEFSNISRLSDDVDGNRFTLVRLTGVHFEDAGKANFAESSGYGTHNLVDAYGNTISVRTSNYADFASTLLPSGTGNVVAVLGRYNGSWQLTIRSIDDVYGFTGSSDDDTPVTPDEPTTATYTVGDAVAPANITAGKYAIGYTYNNTTDGTTTFYLMKHEVFSYNYVAAEAYTAGSEVPEKCVYTVAQSGDGYTIQGSDGTYLEATTRTSGSKTYTNLVPTGTGSGVWTFSVPTEDGVEANACKATFASISTERYMMFTYYASAKAAEFTMAYPSTPYPTNYYRYPIFYKLVEK